MRSLSGGVFRPRGALARTLYDKHQNDCKLREVNKMEWYRCNLETMSEEVRSRFHQLSLDEDTRKFITDSIDKSSWIWTQIWYSLMLNVLGFFMTKTDINGWLGRGSMFVLSLKQLTELIDVAYHQIGASDQLANDIYANHIQYHPDPFEEKMGTFIDIGAGDGEVSLRWSSLFSHMFATEISGSMRKILENKGFQILDTENWFTYSKFSVISMLNLLDRCAQPRSMLLAARQALEDDGLLIVGLVLPFKAYVEHSSDHSPMEQLPIFGDTFEQQVESFIEYAKVEVGMEIVVWTRVPYLCEGDMSQSYYWLDDAIFIFKKI